MTVDTCDNNINNNNNNNRRKKGTCSVPVTNTPAVQYNKLEHAIKQ